jgi:hypothetical protein
MNDYGMSEKQVREFLDKELGRSAASTSFYWENEETEEVMDLLVDAVAKAIAANNKRFKQDWESALSNALARR